MIAVGFYAASVNSSLYIFINLSEHLPTTGILSLFQSGAVYYPGYHTVNLINPVPLNSGELFSVVIKLTTPNYNYPISAERPIIGYSSRASANPGESFISNNGTSWYDLSAGSYKTNVCLKAFIQPTSSPYFINGYVRNPQGNGISYVLINGLPNCPQTNSSGYYVDYVPSGWSGKVTLWKFNSSFTPSFRSYSGVNHTISEQNYLLSRPGCSYSIAPTSQVFSATGGSGSINLSAGSNCPWAAFSQSSWITITSGGSGNGPGVVNYQVASYSGTGLRTGQIAAAGQIFTIFQESNPSGFSPKNFQIIPEAIWAPATGGGIWLTEVQIIDLSGGFEVKAYFRAGSGVNRGLFTLYVNNNGLGRSDLFSNILATLDNLDPDPNFSYYGRVGAIEFVTQDENHRIVVTAFFYLAATSLFLE